MEKGQKALVALCSTQISRDHKDQAGRSFSSTGGNSTSRKALEQRLSRKKTVEDEVVAVQRTAQCEVEVREQATRSLQQSKTVETDLPAEITQ
jgi:hypothetical protein